MDETAVHRETYRRKFPVVPNEIRHYLPKSLLNGRPWLLYFDAIYLFKDHEFCANWSGRRSLARELQARTFGAGMDRTFRTKSRVATSLAVDRCEGPAIGNGKRAITSLASLNVRLRTLLNDPCKTSTSINQDKSVVHTFSNFLHRYTLLSIARLCGDFAQSIHVKANVTSRPLYKGKNSFEHPPRRSTKQHYSRARSLQSQRPLKKHILLELRC